MDTCGHSYQELWAPTPSGTECVYSNTNKESEATLLALFAAFWGKCS